MKPVDPATLPLLAPARGWLAGVVAAGLVGGAAVIGQAFAVAALVVAVVSGTAWTTSAAWVIAVVALRAVAGWVGDACAARAASVVSVSLRDRVVFAGLEFPSPSLSLLATRGVAAVEPYLTRFVPALVVAAFLPLATLAVIASQDLWAGLIVLLTLPLLPVFAVLIGLSTRDRAERQYAALDRLAGHFLDVVRGLPTLVTFNRGSVQSERIRSVGATHRRATTETLRLAFASSAALELIATLSVALVAVSVGLRLASGSLAFPTALVVLLLAPEAYWPIRRVGAEFHAAAEGAGVLGAVAGLGGRRGGFRRGGFPGRPGKLEVVSRNFGWQGSGSADDSPTVDPVSVEIADLEVRHPGASSASLVLPRAFIPATGVTAIVGPSGAGKSTLLRALLGELEPTAGRITFAGEVVPPEVRRPLIAHLPQTPWLTDETIADNLRHGRPDAQDDELWKALAEVELGSVVDALPERLHTPLGEDGAGLSAGQRARLALARVVLADRPYVLLDEPTAHLDAASEQIILRVLRRLAVHSTVVVVAHRSSVVGVADHVVRIEAPASPRIPDVSSADPEPRQPKFRLTTSSFPGRPGKPPRRPATVLATLSTASGVALTATAGWLIAQAAQHPPVLTLMVAIVGVRTFGLARPALRYAERLVSHDRALADLAERRARIYDVLVPLAPARLGSRRRRGDLLASIVDDVDAGLDRELRVRQPVRTAAWVLTAATITAALVTPLAALPLAGLAAATAALTLAARSTARRCETRVVAERADLSVEVTRAFDSARQWVLWQRDGDVRARVHASGERLARTERRAAITLATTRAVLLVAVGLTVAAMAAVADHAAISGPMKALLLLLPLALAEVVAPVPDAGALGERCRAADQRLRALESLTPAVTEPDHPEHTDGNGLRLTEVTAGWERPVLQHLDLDLPRGATVGVVGPSGCGKSTLAGLLVRHLAPSAGTITLGGTEMSALGSPEVRRHVGLVDDAPYLFASSLRENLRLARPDATDDVLGQALDQAGLGGWETELDTMIGEGGRGVSGGEQARIGLARALLADPEVLVLDEPTAHLDTATAREVSRSLLQARKGRSLVWIAHDTIPEEIEQTLDLSPASPRRSSEPRRSSAP